MKLTPIWHCSDGRCAFYYTDGEKAKVYDYQGVTEDIYDTAKWYCNDNVKRYKEAFNLLNKFKGEK